jgi:hypothetical protein
VPDDISVDVVNGPAFTAALERMRRDLDQPKDPLEAAARHLVALAAAAAPHRTGRHAGSHRALPAGGRRVRVAAETPYGAPIHWGWPAHGIRREPWLVATWLRNPAPREAMTAQVQAGLDKQAATI